jgi:hypothetical protein
LSLLMAWVFANNHYAAVPTNDLALLADFFNAGSYFHSTPLFKSICNTTSCEVIRC